MDEDKRIIRRVLDGDVNAFEAIVRKYSHVVLETVGRRVPSADVESVGQDVFVSAFQSLRTYSGRKPVEHWLRRIAVRRCCDYWRTQNTIKQQMNRPRASMDEQFDETVWNMPSRDAYRRKIEEQDAQELLRWALSHLSAEERSLVESVYFEGLPLREISRAFGWSLANTKVKAHRARRTLREVLAHEFKQEKKKGGIQ